jgi:hypothetical protein
MARQTSGVQNATFRDKLRGAIKGHARVPVWGIDDWFMGRVYPVLEAEAESPTDDKSADLIINLVDCADGRQAAAVVEQFLGTDESHAI